MVPVQLVLGVRILFLMPFSPPNRTTRPTSSSPERPSSPALASSPSPSVAEAAESSYSRHGWSLGEDGGREEVEEERKKLAEGERGGPSVKEEEEARLAREERER